MIPLFSANPLLLPVPAAGMCGHQAALAVSPTQAATADRGGGQSGTGSGHASDGQRNNAALFQAQNASAAVPPEAAPASVINAQSHPSALRQDGQFPFNKALPKFEMPYPLPTAPFFKEV